MTSECVPDRSQLLESWMQCVEVKGCSEPQSLLNAVRDILQVCLPAPVDVPDTPESPELVPTTPGLDPRDPEEMSALYEEGWDAAALYCGGVRPKCKAFKNALAQSHAYLSVAVNMRTTKKMQESPKRDAIVQYIKKWFPRSKDDPQLEEGASPARIEAYLQDVEREYGFVSDWKSDVGHCFDEEPDTVCFMWFCARLVAREMVPAFFDSGRREWNEVALMRFIEGAPLELRYGVAHHLRMLWPACQDEDTTPSVPRRRNSI